jgi:hypothetical protein
MDYIEKYQQSHRKSFCDDNQGEIRKAFYTNAKMDVSRAKIRGEISLAQDSIHDIIESRKRKKFTEDEKNYIRLSPKTKEALAIELDCSVFIISKYKREQS